MTLVQCNLVADVTLCIMQKPAATCAAMAQQLLEEALPRPFGSPFLVPAIDPNSQSGLFVE